MSHHSYSYSYHTEYSYSSATSGENFSHSAGGGLAGFPSQGLPVSPQLPQVGFQGGNTLYIGQVLGCEQLLRSQNGTFVARMQADNNFVIYKNPPPEYGAQYSIWASNTFKQGHGHAKLTLQNDHNMVISDEFDNTLWATNTKNCGNGNVRLVMESDGNLVLYDQGNSVLWASNTSGR